jgi:hypothetical protein
MQHCQVLDYVSIPFKCTRCHAFGYLASECTIKFPKKMWVHKTLESIKEKKGKAPKWAKEGLNIVEGGLGGDLFVEGKRFHNIECKKDSTGASSMGSI